MIARLMVVAGLAASVAVQAGAQNSRPISMSVDPNAPKPGPTAGEVAPDFTGPGANKDGTIKAPIHLADFKGKTVVLAFFPKARTGGCTMQMTHYRDLYDSVFVGGKNVVLLGISSDADTTLAAWAKEQNFPFRFVSDTTAAIGMKYGTATKAGAAQSRFVYVIDPDGKITYTKKTFNPAAPAQYDTLGMEIRKTMKK
jgi:peroxiredoxin Q/BCP